MIDRRLVTTIGLAAALLTACGGTASVASTSSSPPPASSAAPANPSAAAASSEPPAASKPAAGASLSKPGAASPTAAVQSVSASAFQSAATDLVAKAAASLPPNGAYACAQPAQAGPPKGKTLIGIPAIEQAIGFKVSSVVPYTGIATVLECEYNFDTPAGGASLKLGIDQNTAHAKDDFAAVQSKHIALLDGGCNGCTLSDVTPISGLGDAAYKAKRNGDPTDVAVLKGAVYFELFSLNLKEERLLNMAHAIAEAPPSS